MRKEMMPTRSRLAVLGCITLLFVNVPLPTPAQELREQEEIQSEAEADEFVPGEVVVLLEDRVPDATMRSLSAAGQVVPAGPSMLRVVKVAEGAEQRVADRLGELTGVVAAEPNLLRTLQASPSDPLYPSQWNLHAIGLDEARESTLGVGSTVAIVDSGAAYADCAGANCDDGSSGTAPDLACKSVLSPYDFMWDDPFPDDESGHGTFVTVVAAGCTDNAHGGASVAPGARIMPLKVCDSTTCALAAVFYALLWAADHGADVINLSLGGPSYSQVEDWAVQYAVSRGVVVVAAAGNDGSSSLTCPACLPEVISVGASRQDGQVAGYSAGGDGLFGQRLDLVAPGGESPNGVLGETFADYCAGTRALSGDNFTFAHCDGIGTSFAAPHVTGVAALLLAKYPGLQPGEVRQALRRSAIDGGPAGWDARFGWGRLWAPGALEAAEIYAQPDTIGVQDPGTGQWHLRQADGTTTSFFFGVPNDLPVACDWDGDGDATVGLYRSSDGFLYLRNTNSQGVADISIFYGAAEDLPVCGDWNSDGVETIGIYRPSEQRFYLRNSNTQGFADFSFVFGDPGDVPFAGDWDGDGIDTVGLWRPSTGRVYITNSNATTVADFDAFYGQPGDRFLVGDWDGDGSDSFGIFRPSDQRFYLSNQIGQAVAGETILFGPVQSEPVAGVWR